nr:MAG TPA: hypothetical protein [Caudoviricetes sp.]
MLYGLVHESFCLSCCFGNGCVGLIQGSGISFCWCSEDYKRLQSLQQFISHFFLYNMLIRFDIGCVFKLNAHLSSPAIMFNQRVHSIPP